MAAGYNRSGLGGDMRVGDAEREAVAAQLREHYATGRLTLDELNERLDQAFAAKTSSDLAAATRDLPQAGQAAPGTAGTGSRTSGIPGWQGGQVPGAGAGSGRLLRGGVLAILPALVAIWGLLLLGNAFALGFRGRPVLGIILLIAALVLLRRVFGWRRRCTRWHGRRRW